MGPAFTRPAFIITLDKMSARKKGEHRLRKTGTISVEQAGVCKDEDIHGP